MEGGQKALSGGAKGKSQGGMEGGLVEGGAMPAAGSLDHRRLTTVDGWQSYMADSRFPTMDGSTTPTLDGANDELTRAPADVLAGRSSDSVRVPSTVRQR